MRESQYNCTGREPVRLLHWTRFPNLEKRPGEEVAASHFKNAFFLISTPRVLVNHELPKLGIVFSSPPQGGGKYSKKFYTGRVRLAEVRLLTLLYTIF